METTGVTLVLGGTRSGKSEIAEAMAMSAAAALDKPVLYVATGPIPGAPSDVDYDEEWSRRVASHRSRRPASWETLEISPGGSLAGALERTGSIVLIDSLGTWLAGVGDLGGETQSTRGPIGSFVSALEDRHVFDSPVIIVSEEVGLGVHPSTQIGGRFREALGALNRAVSERSSRAVLVVAGRTLELGPVFPPLPVSPPLPMSPSVTGEEDRWERSVDRDSRYDRDSRH